MRIALQWTKAEPKNPLAWKALGKAYKNLINHGMDNEGEYTFLVVNRQNGLIITKAMEAYQKTLLFNLSNDIEVWCDLGDIYRDLAFFSGMDKDKM